MQHETTWHPAPGTVSDPGPSRLRRHRLFPSPSAAPTPTAPAQSQPAEAVELIVFAAASMTETLNQIAALYADVAPNVKLTFNFDSSGTLKTQIEEGADCDLFLSAGRSR